MERTTGTFPPVFMEHGREMGALIRSYNWTQSSLGIHTEWPESLRSALSISLNSPFPIAIYWGHDLTLLYNEAWSHIAGAKHPWALGKPGKLVWPELWDVLEEQFNNVLTKGESIRSTDALLLMKRYGYTEECYFDYTLSPITDPDGNTGGVFNAVIETTYRVINERRNIILHQLARRVNEATSVEDAYSIISEIIETANLDIPFCLIYSLENDMPVITNIKGILRESIRNLQWPFEKLNGSGNAVYIDGINGSLQQLTGFWPEPCNEALLLPLRNSQGILTGYMAAGISPRKKLDVNYRNFLDSVAGYIGTMISNAALSEAELKVKEQVKKQEENLRIKIDEQRKLVTLVNNSIELMSILELNGTNSYLNKAGMEMLGFDNQQQVSETPISALHTPEDIVFVETNVLPAVLNTGHWSGQMNVRHIKTGEVFPVYNNTVRIDDPLTHQPLAIGAVMRDMRPELASQQALKESERNFRNMIIQAPVAMCILRGPEYIVEIANDRMIALWGTQLENVLQRPIFEGLPEAKAQGLEEYLHSVYTTGKTFSAYGLPMNLPRNGITETVFVNFTYEAFREADGSISGVMAVASEVTEQLLATAKIANSEARFRLLADSMAQFVWTGDNHGNLNYFNQAVYDYSGLTYEQVQKDGWIEIIHPADRKENIQKWNHSIQTGEDFIFNHRFRNKKGDYRWQLSRAVPQKDAEGKIQLWVGTSTDIHDHKLFEEQLQAAVKERTAELEKKNIELEQFAYVSSHDLQEPLRKINMFSQRIMDSEYEQLSDTSKTYFNKITESVMRMSTSLKDLLNFNSLDKEAHYEQVDLNEVLSGILKDLELLIYQKRAVIYSDQLPVIRAIPMQMHQLFYNLVNNALKFATEGVDPVIAINISIATPEQISENKLNSDKHYFEINIKDNGIGFEQAYAEKIFEMFQRLHSKHSFSGTGIGLALCKKVVLNHEGVIKATSSPGEGATFQIILPKD